MGDKSGSVYLKMGFSLSFGKMRWDLIDLKNIKGDIKVEGKILSFVLVMWFSRC